MRLQDNRSGAIGCLGRTDHCCLVDAFAVVEGDVSEVELVGG